MKPNPPKPKPNPPARGRSTLGWWYTATGKARERKLWGTAIGIGAALLFPLINGWLHLGWEAKVIPIALFIILALGLNVVVGFAGLLDLGYAAFFAIGAYTMAFLTSTVSPIGFVREGNHVNFFLAMFVSAGVAAVFGVLLGAPTLRLRGDYLAIVTLGFGEIVPLVIKNTPEITKGTQGMNPIGYPEVPGFANDIVAQVTGAPIRFAIDPIPWYYLIVAVLMLSVLITARLRTSRVGRAWAAMREDEVAAASMGINLVSTKLFAFALGASFSGFAGSVWASYTPRRRTRAPSSRSGPSWWTSSDDERERPRSARGDEAVRRACCRLQHRLRHPAGIDREPHRSERRRQDDLLQHHRRSIPPDERNDHLRRPQHLGPTAAPDHAARHRPNVPEHPTLSQHERAGERHGRPSLAHEGHAIRGDPSNAARAARRARDGRAVPRAPEVRRPRGPRQRHREEPALWRPAPARDGARARDRAEAAAARRADGRNGSQ